MSLKQIQKRKDNKQKLLITGKNIYLREIKLSDVNKNYRRWINDIEVNRCLESRFNKWSIKKLENYVKKIRKDPNNVFLAIITKDENSHIGNIKIGPIDWNHKFADVGIIIGEKAFWGKGFATEAIKLVTDFAFKKLNLHKLNAGAYANNIGSIKAFKKAGFSVEGLRKKQYFYNGSYIDDVLLGVFCK